MMRASKLIQGEISSHRRPLRWVYPFDDGGEHGPLFPLQVSTPLHWDFTNLLVWPSPLTPPWGERNVTLPVAMRRSHTFCAHRYSMLFPFRGSSWVLRRYHPQITVGFSPAVPLTWREGLYCKLSIHFYPLGTVMGLCQLLLNEPFTLSKAIRSHYAMTPVRLSPHLTHGKYSCMDCLTNSGRKGWLQSTRSSPCATSQQQACFSLPSLAFLRRRQPSAHSLWPGTFRGHTGSFPSGGVSLLTWGEGDIACLLVSVEKEARSTLTNSSLQRNPFKTSSLLYWRKCNTLDKLSKLT